MTRPSPDRIAIALLTFLVVLSFADVLFLGEGLARGDLYHYHFPMKKIVRDAIRSGEFPWWNRLYSGGQPLAANPAYELFYPGQWPILIGSYRFGFNLHIVLHVWIAAVGMYALLRALPLGIAASLLGAVSFSLSGYFFSSISSLPLCFVWSWTPLALFLLLRFAKVGRRVYFALGAIVVGMQLLIGEPLSVALNCALIAAFSLWFAVRAGRPLWKSMFAVTLLLLAAAGVAAVQLLPAIDHVRDTSRAEGLPYQMVVARSALPERALEMFFPHLLGRHRESGAFYWAIARYGAAPYLPNIYLGLLIAAGVAAAGRMFPRETLLVLFLCLVAFLFAMGRHSPLAGFYELSIARFFRYPEKWLAMIVIPLILLGAAVFDRIAAGDRIAWKAAATSSALIATLATAAAAVSFLPTYPEWFAAWWGISGASVPSAVAVARQDWLVTSALALSLAVVVILRHRISYPIWSALVALFVIADLHRVSSDIKVTMPRQLFEAPAAVSAITEARSTHALFHLGDWRTDEIDPRYFQRGETHYWIARNGLVPPISAAWGIRNALEHDFDETYLRPTRELLRLMRSRRHAGIEDWWQPIAALSNVRYVADYRRLDDVMRESSGEFALSRPISLRQASTDHPRYYFASRVFPVSGSSDVDAHLRSEALQAGTAFVQARALPSTPAYGRLLNLGESANTALIDVEADGTAVLVLTVTPHRYWKVTLDGRPAGTHVTNVGYQGLVIPRGRHRVEMRYRNPWVVAGAAISIATLAILMTVTLRDRRAGEQP